jgi:hypothetical protein
MSRTYTYALGISLAALLACGISACSAPEHSSGQDFGWADAPEGLEELVPEERAMAVLAGLFGGGVEMADENAEDEDGFALLDMLVASAHADPPYNFCTDDPAVTYVTNSLRGASGTYGSDTQPVAIDSNANFCQDAAGNSQPNAANELYKAWSASGILLTCSWGEEYNFSGSGVIRHTSQYEIDVHGGVALTGGPASGNYDCTFFATSINSDTEMEDTLHGGSCTDPLGNTWTNFNQVNTGGHCVATIGDTSVNAPTAVCGEDSSAYALDTATFDGSGSIDPYGRPLAYTWILSRPDGSTASLDDITSATPAAMLDLVGTYEAQLTVTTVDGGTDSCTQTYTATSFENFRIEMWWDSADDMDLHLLEANDGSGNQGTPRTQGDCYYGNCNTSSYWVNVPDWGVPSVATDDPGLDLDDIWGTGPENINIEQPAQNPYTGWYQIFVHDYPWTARNYDPNGVHLNIYLNGSIVRTYDFMIAGENADYYVAKIHWPSGTIVDCNGLGGC